MLNIIWTNSPSLNDHEHELITVFFSRNENGIWYCTYLCTCMQILHYGNNIKVCSKAKWKTIHKYSVLIKLSTRSLVIGSVTPTLQHNINSLWHVLIKRHAIMFTKIGIHWTHTLPYSWIPLGGVVGLFKRCLRSAQKCSMGFKFGDCACHWRSWNGCDANHSCTILLMSMESLSCWKTNLLGSRL